MKTSRFYQYRNKTMILFATQYKNDNAAFHRGHFEGVLHIRGACFHAFQTNIQIGHTCVGPQKQKWLRPPRLLNPSLGPRAHLNPSLGPAPT